VSDSVISVENLGKKYRIKHQADRQPYKALRDALRDKTKGVAKRLWSAVRAFPLRLDRGECQGEVSKSSRRWDRAFAPGWGTVMLKGARRRFPASPPKTSAANLNVTKP